MWAMTGHKKSWRSPNLLASGISCETIVHFFIRPKTLFFNNSGNSIRDIISFDYDGILLWKLVRNYCVYRISLDKSLRVNWFSFRNLPGVKSRPATIKDQHWNPRPLFKTQCQNWYDFGIFISKFFHLNHEIQNWYDLL